MSGRSELFRFLLVGTLAATEAGCVPEQKSPEDQQALGPDVISTSPLEKSILTFTPTATLARAQTETQTPVPEPMPTTCLDPEVNAKIIAEYLDGTQYRTLQEAMDAWRNSDFNPRITRGGLSIVTSPVQGEIYNPKWYIAYEMKVLGGYRFSIADQSGYRDGDYAICIIAASPHMGEIVAPIIIGVERKSQWSQVTGVYDNGSSGVPSRVNRVIGSGDQAEAWVQEMRGKVIFPLIALRFDKPDWERDPLWHFGYDSILPLLRNPDGYIMRYTNNPSELGSPLTFPDGKPAGEQASLTRVIRDLNPDLSGDIGLFTSQITVRN